MNLDPLSIPLKNLTEIVYHYITTRWGQDGPPGSRSTSTMIYYDLNQSRSIRFQRPKSPFARVKFHVNKCGIISQASVSDIWKLAVKLGFSFDDVLEPLDETAVLARTPITTTMESGFNDLTTDEHRDAIEFVSILSKRFITDKNEIAVPVKDVIPDILVSKVALNQCIEYFEDRCNQSTVVLTIPAVGLYPYLLLDSGIILINTGKIINSVTGKYRAYRYDTRLDSLVPLTSNPVLSVNNLYTTLTELVNTTITHKYAK